MDKNLISFHFFRALRFIGEETRLILEQSEKREIRELVNHYSKFSEVLVSVGIEAALHFLNEDYAFGVYNIKDRLRYSRLRDKEIERLGYDPYALKFRDMQKEKFNLS